MPWYRRYCLLLMTAQRKEGIKPGNRRVLVRCEALTSASMTITVFWNVAPCSLIVIYGRFRYAYCLYHQDSVPDDGDSKNLWIVSQCLLDYTAQHPRRVIFIALMMEIVRTPETSVSVYETTRRNVSESHFHRPDEGCSKNLWNAGQCLRDYTAQHPRRAIFIALIKHVVRTSETLVIVSETIPRIVPEDSHLYRPDDGDSKNLWNVGQCLRHYTAQHPRRVISNALMKDVVRTSETSVSVYETTRRNIPEDSHLQKDFVL
jgi:hypothetical protein